MKLYEAFGIVPGDVVAFVGAGGKSGAITQVSRELVEDGTRVIVAPTTKMSLKEADGIGAVVTSEDKQELLSAVRDALEDGDPDARAVVAGSGLLSRKRVGGVEPDWVPSLAPLADVVLVEADGSRRRPLKGTASHEPLLPDAATLVVAVGGIWALGKPLGDEYVHRPEALTELTGVGEDHSITAEAFAAALVHGSLGKVPDDVRRAVLLTGVTPGRSMSDASAVAREVWKIGVSSVTLNSLPTESPGKVWPL
ncbi:MAG: putative selenium-dependent hydroxylase accessory protein YqeC [Rubrobacter sp.]|nr:putative selenium-dependent hydroxylase accessory protein YqeC [Rubrobacter sp.]